MNNKQSYPIKFGKKMKNFIRSDQTNEKENRLIGSKRESNWEKVFAYCWEIFNVSHSHSAISSIDSGIIATKSIRAL